MRSSLPCGQNEEVLLKDFIIRSIRRRWDIGPRATTTGSDPGSTNAGQHWSPLQKSVPIIVGVTTFLVLVSLFLLRQKFVPRIRAWFTRLPYVKRSHPQRSHSGSEEMGDKDEAEYPNSIGDDYVSVHQDPSTPPRTSPVERSYWSDYSSSRHHHRETRITLPSLIIPGLRRSASASSESWQFPGVDTLRNMKISERLQAIPTTFTNPWGRPSTVQHVAYTRRFRINDPDRSTVSSTPNSTPSHFSQFSSPSKHKTSTENGLGSRTHETILEDEELDIDSEMHGGNDERHNLLPNNDSVFLISRGGRNFTLDGSSDSTHIRPNIASLSTSSRSEESEILVRATTPPRLWIPPHPRGPAPPPPVRSRSPEDGPNVQPWEASKSRASPGRSRRHIDFSPYSPPPDLAHFEVTQPSPLRAQRRLSEERPVPLRPMESSPPYGLQEAPPYVDREALPTLLTPHRRHYSADGAVLSPWNGISSVYNGSPTHTRRGSAESVISAVTPKRLSTVMLFPPVVRGAGYRVGNRSSDSLHSNSSFSPRYPPGMSN